MGNKISMRSRFIVGGLKKLNKQMFLSVLVFAQSLRAGKGEQIKR